jgi:hypothetical protein
VPEIPQGAAVIYFFLSKRTTFAYIRLYLHYPLALSNFIATREIIKREKFKRGADGLTLRPHASLMLSLQSCQIKAAQLLSPGAASA